MSHIQLDGVSLGAADKPPLFPPLSESISHEVVGLFGRNGSGKSTLLSAIAGLRMPASGTIVVDGKIAVMQQGAFAADQSIAQALGIAAPLAILRRIESGAPHASDLEEADWDLPSRVERTLAQTGLPGLCLDRPAAHLSGGQQCRVKLAALLLAEPDILLLDEPTNDLDEAGRELVHALLREWEGPALVASHDRALLENMDRIIELSPAGALTVGGGWSAFKEQRDAIRAQATQALEEAEQQSKKASAIHQARSERQARRSRQGKVAAARRDDSKLQVNAQKGRAQKTAARTTAVGQEQVARTRDAVQAAAARVERLVPIRIELPPSGLQRGHRLVEARAITCVRAGRPVFGPLDLNVTGPERIALTGPNGSGKSSLLRIISGELSPDSGCVRSDGERMALLDQHLSLLQPVETAMASMQRHNPCLDEREAHAALARYGFRSEWGRRTVETLSGGERVRLALACLFSGPVQPALLILDEPTNHLDIHAIEMLEDALYGYDGAIICVSHDSSFRAALGLDRTIDLGGP